MIEQSVIPHRFPAEKSDKAFFFRRTFVDLQMHHVITFTGHIDEDLMAKAVRRSLDAEPVLGCKYIENWWQPFWQRRNDLDTLNLCSVTAQEDSKKALLDYLTVSLDPCTDPLVKVKIFRSKKSDTLCIKINHAVVDAAGLLEYSQLLASIYCKLEVNPSYQPSFNITGDRSIDQVLTTFDTQSKLKMIRRGFCNWKRDTFPRQNWHLPIQNNSTTKEWGYIIRKIPANLFRAMKIFGKERGATVNDMIVTVFFRAFYKAAQPKPGTPLRLGTTVNLRRYLSTQKGGALCNLANLVQVNIGCDIKKELDDTLALVKEDYATLTDDFFGLGVNRFDIFRYRIIPFYLARQLCTAFSIVNSWIAPKEVTPLLSNGGVIRPEPLNFGKLKVIDSYMTPPTTDPSFLIVAFTGFQNTITMSTGFREPAVNRSVVNQLFDYVEEELCSL